MALRKKARSTEDLYQFLIGNIDKWSNKNQLTSDDREIFLDELLRGENIDDLLKRPPEEAIRTVKTLWEVFQKRKFEDIYIHIDEDAFNQADRVDITIMQRQIPFITDSILNLLRQSHIFVTVMLNATIKTRRDDDGQLLSVHPDQDMGPDLQTDKVLHLQCEHRGEKLNPEYILHDISNVLRDVHAVVEDWRPMQGQIVDAINETENSSANIDQAESYEAAQFLTFLKDGNFTFLGYREHTLRHGKKNVYFDTIEEKSLGLLRDKEFLLFEGLVVDELIPAEVQKVLADPHPVMMVIKANRLASVHRHVQMDVIILKQYDADGNVNALRLFSGLFTAQCYARPAEQIPYLKRKVNEVIEKSGYEPETHSWRALRHVLDSYPRDELFQISVDELYEQAIGINRLNNRPQIDVFVRKDPLQRFFSVLVFLPKEQYTTGLRSQVRTVIEEELQGKVISDYMMLDERPLARLQYTIACGTLVLPEFDLNQLKQRLIDACTPWFERLKIAALEKFGKERTQELLTSMTNAFSVSYQDQVSITHALEDLEPIQQVLHDREMAVVLHRHEDDEEGIYRIKLYKRDEEARLSELLPMLDRMGFDCLHEYSYAIHAGKRFPAIWIHEMVGTISYLKPETLETIQSLFAEAFEMIWRNKVDSDSFNSLTLAASLTWREANVFRALARYLDLANYPLGKRYIGQVLAKYADITQELKNLFLAKMDPEKQSDLAPIQKKIETLLEKVEKLDEDSVLRSMMNIIENILRTNYFHVDAEGNIPDVLVLKLASREIKDLPQPRPLRELFVYGTRFEAVHLRGGMIARGGIRWSDRYEDFRTEILGLMKAQQVKNSVIVPVGAKGGFICKNQPGLKTPQERQAEGVACYKLMIEAFLSVTDNLVDNKIVAPGNTLRLDGDDPYFVVAADKGTATFSDIANEISINHNFWLGDAFASGGSVGYDHKAMGITARGAWECIKRHFRELGKDIQTEEFSVVGVGDMSGDVFGNGMLLSPMIRLVAAFDHRHIFIDPSPDIAKSFAERQRLFEKAGSSWMDYNQKLISKGGAIFNRQDKAVTLTPEIQALFGITKERVTPNELMNAILKAEVELLYFGGIGTYVKAEYQSHEQAGDKANDAIRVNGNQLRCKVVGEGANLGVTQAGRIEYASKGGKIDTDFIDNSAGVDTSDHEVNIKILLQPLVNSGKLANDKRVKLLSEMTDDVAVHVLKDNYDQSLALSLQEKRAADDLAEYVDFMRMLERQGELNRKLEGLPDDDRIQQLTQSHRGLTRPELCVILAYSKISLYNQIIESDLPDDPEMADHLMGYFPPSLQSKFKTEIQGHKLKREIVGTVLANVVINRMGSIFAANEMARGYTIGQVVRAWLLVTRVFDLDTLWMELNGLDNKVPADLQLKLYHEVINVMGHGVKWFLQNYRDSLNDKKIIPLYREQLVKLEQELPTIVPQGILQEIGVKLAEIEPFDAITPELKKRLLQLSLVMDGTDVTFLTQNSKVKSEEVAKAYFAIKQRLRLSSIMSQLEIIPVETPWAEEAIESLKDEVQDLGTTFTKKFLDSRKDVEGLEDWLKQSSAELDAADAALKDFERLTVPDLSLLTVLVQRLRRFANAMGDNYVK